MKPLKILSVVLVALGMYSVCLQASEIEPNGTSWRKAQRGLLNIALSPIEISNELAKEIKNDTFPPSWVAGIGRGTAFMVGRALVGAYELVTFPIPYPAANYEPILSPEFAWEHLPKEKA